MLVVTDALIVLLFSSCSSVKVTEVRKVPLVTSLRLKARITHAIWTEHSLRVIVRRLLQTNELIMIRWCSKGKLVYYMPIYWGISVKCHVILTPAMVWSEGSALGSGRHVLKQGTPIESSWNLMAHGDARNGKWKENWRMEWVASTLYTTSEHDVSSITTADVHTWATSSRLNWPPRRFKWNRPFRRKTISGFCACAITFQTQASIGEEADVVGVGKGRTGVYPRVAAGVQAPPPPPESRILDFVI
jgi:hypothetical protein